MKFGYSQLKKIHNFIFFEIDPFILSFYRILLGAAMLVYYLALAPNWARYYGVNGFAPPTKSIFEYVLFDSLLHYATSDLQVWLFYGVSIFACMMLMVGLLGRLPIIWIWIANFSISIRNPAVLNGEEQILGLILFWSLFLPLNSSLSLANLIKKKKAPIKVKAWALRPLQIQIALIYLFSLPHKLVVPDWQKGTIVYHAMSSIQYTRWPELVVFRWGEAIVSRLLTYGILALQVLFPLLVWVRKFRVWLVFGMMSVQLSISILIQGVSAFSFMFIVALTLFLPSHDTRVWFEKLLRIIRKLVKK